MDLTSRELDLVKGVVQGKTNKQIGDDLHLSEGTVKEYMNKIFKKLQLDSRTKVAIWAIKNLSLMLIVSMLLFAQTAGTINVTTSNTVTAVAGTVTCTFTSNAPALPTGVHTVCTAATSKMTQDAVVAPGSTNGVTGQMNNATDAVTWILTQPSASSLVHYALAANGTQKSGDF